MLERYWTIDEQDRCRSKFLLVAQEPEETVEDFMQRVQLLALDAAPEDHPVPEYDIMEQFGRGLRTLPGTEVKKLRPEERTMAKILQAAATSQRIESDKDKKKQGGPTPPASATVASSEISDEEDEPAIAAAAAAETRCDNCGGKGHMSRTCSSPCGHCEETGHHVRNCPKTRGRPDGLRGKPPRRRGSRYNRGSRRGFQS